MSNNLPTHTRGPGVSHFRITLQHTDGNCALQEKRTGNHTTSLRQRLQLRHTSCHCRQSCYERPNNKAGNCALQEKSAGNHTTSLRQRLQLQHTYCHCRQSYCERPNNKAPRCCCRLFGFVHTRACARTLLAYCVNSPGNSECL